MYEIARVLGQKYGWRVTYEDPPFENMADLVDITHPLYRATHRDVTDAMLIPRARAFTFVWNSTGTAAGLRQSVLDQCVNQHNNMSRNPGQFASYQQGDVSHIVAMRVRGKDGSMMEINSPLGTDVSFPAQQRTLLETISLILDTIGNRTGIHIEVGVGPSYIMTQSISMGADQISARDALLLALNASDGNLLQMGISPLRMSWAMLYQADEKRYYLNLYPTKEVRPASDLLLGPSR
jgi:hypothetical protein